MHVLGTPDDPAAFTDFDSSNPVELVFKGRTYCAYRQASAFSLGGVDRRSTPRLVYVSEPGEHPVPFGYCDKSDDRTTVAARLRAFLEELNP